MLKSFSVVLCCVFALAGCTPSSIETVAADPSPNAFGKDGDLTDLSLKQLVDLNFDLEFAFQKTAEQAEMAHHASNAFLLSAALGVALGELGSASAKSIERQIAITLGINEGFKYANPAQVARAYRKAAREALCMAQTTVTQGVNKTPAETELTSAKENSLANRVKFAVAMRLSHTNLRERLTRSSVGFLSVLNNIRDQKEALEREDRILAENKLSVAIATNKKDYYSARLLSCLE